MPPGDENDVPVCSYCRREATDWIPWGLNSNGTPGMEPVCNYHLHLGDDDE